MFYAPADDAENDFFSLFHLHPAQQARERHKRTNNERNVKRFLRRRHRNEAFGLQTLVEEAKSAWSGRMRTRSRRFPTQRTTQGS